MFLGTNTLDNFECSLRFRSRFKYATSDYVKFVKNIVIPHDYYRLTFQALLGVAKMKYFSEVLNQNH